MTKARRVYIDSNVLRLRRTAKGWTMSDLARQMGVEVSTTARWEHRGWVTRKYVIPLAEALGIEADEIVRQEPEDDQSSGRAT